MAQQVKGKTAIVTGAGSGINLEFARLLLHDGANVLFADLSLRPEAEELVSKYQSTPNKAFFQRTDVTSWQDLEAMFSVAQQHFGSVDIYPPGTEKSKDDPASGRYKILDINLTHPIRVSQLAISYFLAADPPSSPANPKSIVHIASIAGQSASLIVPLYHVSKHGVQALVRSLAYLEDSHGIRVTGVNPGVVKTPLWLEDAEKLKIVKQEGEDADVWVTPEEVAQVMLSCVKDNEIPNIIEGRESVTEGVERETIPIKGGSCLEVLAGAVRDVPMFNNVGPNGLGRKGATVSDGAKLMKDVLGVLKPGWGKV